MDNEITKKQKKQRKHPKVLKALLNLTENDNKIPTDYNLDQDIAYLAMLMHVVWPLIKLITRKKIYLFFKYKWKRVAKYVLYFLLLSASVIITWSNMIVPVIVKENTKVIANEIYVTNLKTYDEFVNAVGIKESGNDWQIVNSAGMLGRFQFSPSTLKSIGINVEKEYFLADTILQLASFKRLLYLNRILYHSYIQQWEGKPLPQDKRYTMTESGIVMAFHLKPSAAIQYFKSGALNDTGTDGNGTSVSTYIKKFSGYKLD